jgi:hypothetical protein
MGGMNGATIKFLRFDHDAQLGAALALSDGRRFAARVKLADYDDETVAAAALAVVLAQKVTA